LLAVLSNGALYYNQFMPLTHHLVFVFLSLTKKKALDKAYKWYFLAGLFIGYGFVFKTLLGSLG
jgi:hypothetical protein